MGENGVRVCADLSQRLRLVLDFPPYEANMKVITAIYLNCRPDLRDEWLAGNEMDDTNDVQVSFHIPYRSFVHPADVRLGPESGERVTRINTIL